MIYKLTFLLSAKKEWYKLSTDIRAQFKKKLLKRLDNPIVPKDSLSGIKHCFKIKLKSSGYRLVYKVIKNEVIVQVIAIGLRERLKVYDISKKRL